MKAKLPIIYQSETVECGLAVLAMLLQYFGYHVSLADLRRKHPVSLSGLSLAALLTIARDNHLNTRVLRIEMHDLQRLTTPAILHWNMNHFVLLKQVNKRNFVIHDPGRGIVTINQREMSDSFTGIAVECTHTAMLVPNKQRRHSRPIVTLIKHIPNVKTLLLKLFIFAFIYQMFILAMPSYFHYALDNFVTSQQVDTLILLTIGYIGLRILITIAKLLKAFCSLQFDNQINYILGVTVMQHIMRLPLSYFQKRQLGDLLYRFNSIEQLRQLISNGLIDGGWSGLLAVSTLAVMLYISPPLSLICLLFSITYIIIKLYLIKKQRLKTAEMLTAKAHEQASLIENIRGIQPIKMYNKEADRISHWLNRYVGFLTAAYKSALTKIISDNLKECLLGLELIFLVCISALKLMHHQITMGFIYSYLFYRQQFTDSLYTMIDKIQDFNMLSVYRERLDDILYHPVEVVSELAVLTPTEFSISANNLAYRYSDAEPFLFSQLNFTIKQGECVVFVGPSGVGKSTLLKILMGLLAPSSGYIAIGNIPLDRLVKPRRYFASVMQDDSLLTGSIAQNIAFFDYPLDMERVYECAKLMGIYSEIMGMPMKFATLVGDMGTTLSGGQKQRILLARAIYAAPKILILDEASSHLDHQKEVEVNRAIKSLGMTCVMVAHRTETIKMADRVISLFN